MEPVRTEVSRPVRAHQDTGTLEPGALLAERYRVLRKIGEGGMGVLYACEDCVLAREVALKLMQRSIAADPVLSERLLREARLAAQLRKHVAQVFDCGTLVTGEPYIVMELLHGRDLYSVLKEFGPLSPVRLTAYMLELCVGLGEAHEKGIIHRDLKPENLYLADEPDGSTVLKIVDFGVSKQLTSGRFRTQTNPGESVGSPQYMSPEQITTPSEVDARTDIWSLGVVMFELLTGSVPFNGAGPAQVCAAVLTQPVPPFSDYRDDIAPALEAIVLRCLERDRERRFENVGALAAALSALSMSEEAPALPTRVSSRLTRAPGRARRWLSALCAVAVLGACVAVLGLAVRDGRIRVPSASDLSRLPAGISAWHLPFLSPSPAPGSAPAEQLGPATSPNAALEQRPLAPAQPLTNVQSPASASAPAPALASAAAVTTASVRHLASPPLSRPRPPALGRVEADPPAPSVIDYPKPVPPVPDLVGETSNGNADAHSE